MKSNPIKKELLFIHHSSNSPNKCVYALIDNTTNIITPNDLTDTQILLTIGLSSDDINECAEFFKS